MDPPPPDRNPSTSVNVVVLNEQTSSIMTTQEGFGVGRQEPYHKTTAGSHLLALFQQQQQQEGEEEEKVVERLTEETLKAVEAGATPDGALLSRSASAEGRRSGVETSAHVNVLHRHDNSKPSSDEGRKESSSCSSSCSSHIQLEMEEFPLRQTTTTTNATTMSLYGTEWNQYATSSYLTSHSWDPANALAFTGLQTTFTGKQQPQGKTSAARLGTVQGVLLPCLQNIFGIILFVRLPWITGMAGVGLTLLIVLLSVASTVLTAISMSAIATNGHVPAGGPYYMISRSLGKELGVAVGLLFYSTNCIGGAMYILGAVEILVKDLAPSISSGNLTQDSRWYGLSLLVALAFVALLGMRRLSRFAMLFLGAVVTAILFILLGLWSSNRPGLPPDEVVGFPGNLQDNLAPGFMKPDLFGEVNPEHVGFFALFALFYPSVTGIMAGCSRSGDLKNAAKSIPRGTLGAIGLSSSVYLLFVFFFGTVCTGAFLRTKIPPNGMHAAIVTWPHPLITLIGVTLSSTGAALQCLVNAPRLLQAVSKDDIIPFLAFFKVTHRGEPLRALGLTFLLTTAAVLVGSLDAVAPISTMLYLTCYAFVNLSTALLSLLKYPNWRPSWTFYHWSMSLLGALMCFAYMFLINYIFACVALLLVAVLYKYVEYRGAQVEWGNGLRALHLKVAQTNLLALETKPIHAKNWRPQIMVFLEMDPQHQMPTDPQLLSFLSQLRKGGGLSILTSVLHGDWLNSSYSQRVSDCQDTLQLLMKEHGIKGFPQVLVAPDILTAKLMSLQAVGLGVLRPNTLLMAYPTHWRDPKHPRAALDFFLTLKATMATEKVAMILKLSTTHVFPTVRSVPFSRTEYMDVYWILQDGGVLMLLPYLLKKHRIWRKCKLRVFCIAELQDDSIQMQKDLEILLQKFRIEAEAKVIELTDSDMSEYTYEKTLQMERRQALLNELQAEVVLASAPKTSQQGAPSSSQGLHHQRPRKKRPSKEKAAMMHTSVQLNELIRHHSSRSALVFLSLPRPSPSQSAQDYLEYLDTLTEDLPHAVLIKGSGCEVVTTIV